MLIGIDASRANKDNRTGTEWYSYHIIEELKKIIPANHRVVLYTNNKLEGDLSRMPSNWQEKVLKWPLKYLWTQIRLWWELLIHPPDFLFVPAHTIPFLFIRKKTKILVNVHDVGFKRFPKLYKSIQIWYHDLTMKKIRKRANIIITISQFSKEEIIDLYNVDKNKIKVVYLGYDKNIYQPSDKINSEILDKYKIKKPYLLYVGRLEKKKNIGNIVSAFVLNKIDHLDLKLVLAGNAGNDFEAITEIIKNNKLEEEIIMPGYVKEDDLPELMRQSEIFLFPTLYEGFGLPILQAMACGAPVITSDQNPHKEVAREAAAFADAGRPQEIASQIDKILRDPEFKDNLKEQGFQRVKEFSWRKTAQSIFNLIIEF